MPPKSRALVLGVIVLLAVILSPLAYVLSLGPALWLMRNEWLPGQWFARLYYPLQWLADHNESMRSILEWYLSWWR